jgi:hypothetical protein
LLDQHRQKSCIVRQAIRTVFGQMRTCNLKYESTKNHVNKSFKSPDWYNEFPLV